MTNMTKTDSDITRDDRDEIVITKGMRVITRSYRREREGIGEKERERELEVIGEKERVRTIGLD